MDFAAERICRSLGGTAVIAGAPADWQFGDGVGQVIDDVLANLFGRTPGAGIPEDPVGSA